MDFGYASKSRIASFPIYELLKVEYGNLSKSKSSLSLDFAQTRSQISDNFYNLMSEETSILCSVAKLKNNFERKASILALPMAHKWHVS